MDKRQELQRLVQDLVALAASRPTDALRRCREILGQAPDLVPLLVLAGRIERLAGDKEEARRLLAHAAQVDPDAGPAHAELGMLATSGGEYRKAIRHFEAWTRCQPRLADAWFNLGLARERSGRFASAAEAYRQALGLTREDRTDTRLRLAGVLALAGREDESRTQYRAVLDADAGNLDARFGLGLIRLAEGESAAAMADFRACVERSPEFAEAWQQIVAMRRITDSEDKDLQAVRSLLERPTLAPLARERLSFAAGKALDDLARYDEAFTAYHAANELKRARLPRFDPVAWRELTEQRAAAAGPAPAAAASGSTQPVFIVGMPRSGTTLVDQILSAHPLAAGVGEWPFLDEITMSPAGDDRSPDTPAGQRLSAARDGYMARLRVTGATVVTNKYPANFTHLPLIWRLFPDARVVHVTRSALDTCLSIYFQDFPVGNLYANSMTDIASYYCQYRRLMTQTGTRAELLAVSYEALLQDQEGVSRRIVAHCGLPWDPACLDFAANRRPVGTLSRWQVRQPIYRSSMGRWRYYRRQLTPLIEALGDYADVD